MGTGEADDLALRLMEVVVPQSSRERVEAVLEDAHVHAPLTAEGADDRVTLRAVLFSDETGPIIERLEQEFGYLQGFRVIIYPVEAALPRPRRDEEDAGAAAGNGGAAAEPAAAAIPENGRDRTPRISIEELYQDITDRVGLDNVYVGLVLLATVVAAIGLVQNSVVVVIGAMVIAPLLGPNVALSLATTTADPGLAKHAIRVNLAGLVLALGAAVLLGFGIPVDPSVAELASRTRVGLPEVALALAAGSAGALSFTTGVSAALIGVMVAAALVPPLVAAGLFLGAGYPDMALAAGLLVAVNVICINLAGVVTFLAQGVRPRGFRAKGAASRATVAAIALWLGLLAVLLVAIRYATGQWFLAL